MRMAPTPSGECLTQRDPELASWLLGYEVLSDVEGYLAERGGEREEGVRRKGWYEFVGGGRGYKFYTLCLFFCLFKLPVCLISVFFSLHFTFLSALIVILALYTANQSKFRALLS